MTRATTLAACVVRLLRPMATAWRAISAPYSAAVISGVAPHAAPPPSPAGSPQTRLSTETLIHRRAMRTCNRKPDAVEAFVNTHKILSRDTDMTLTITLPWPSRDLSPNGRAHHMAHHRAKKSAKNYAWGMTAAAMGPLGIVKGSWVGPIDVLVSVHPHRTAPDADNALACQKAALDGIASAIGVDDKHFRPRIVMGEKCNPAKVVITLTPTLVNVEKRGQIS